LPCGATDTRRTLAVGGNKQGPSCKTRLRKGGVWWNEVGHTLHRMGV
jgi:hypothetical protein